MSRARYLERQAEAETRAKEPLSDDDMLKAWAIFADHQIQKSIDESEIALAGLRRVLVLRSQRRAA